MEINKEYRSSLVEKFEQSTIEIKYTVEIPITDVLLSYVNRTTFRSDVYMRCKLQRKITM